MSHIATDTTPAASPEAIARWAKKRAVLSVDGYFLYAQTEAADLPFMKRHARLMADNGRNVRLCYMGEAAIRSLDDQQQILLDCQYRILPRLLKNIGQRYIGARSQWKAYDRIRNGQNVFDNNVPMAA